jgi:filamentous hemagglutinin family protein
MQRKIIVLVFIFSLFVPVQIHALPEGENVISGQASFDRSTPDTLNINTPSDRLIAEYNSFSIAAPEAVHFYQPSSSSIALNRVVGVSPSEIFGILTATGKIFLINPNGVLFAPGSHVDAAALVASTLNISNSDFLAGNYSFIKVDGKTAASILNQGYIQANSVSLLGQAVANSGVIEATLGSVVLAAGEAVTLNLDSAGMISVVIAEPVKEAVLGADAAVENSGQILADGGKVILSADTLNNVFDYAVNNSGLIQANSLVADNGGIELVAQGEDSNIVNSGTLDVTSQTEGVSGGSVNVAADYIDNIGKIIADAADYAQAGSISLVANKELSLEDTSLISARGKDIESSGGNVYLYSYGDAYAKAGQTIDISGGSISGNGGVGELSAQNHVTFGGHIIGNAQEGFSKGYFVLDPEDSTIEEQTISADATYYTAGNMWINGDVTINSGYTLNLFADHSSETVGDWHNGIGTLTRTGDYTISGGDKTTLNLKAGERIGTAENPIQTSVTYLSAETNPDEGREGSVYINQSGDLNLTQVTLNGPGDVNIQVASDLTISGQVNLNDGDATLKATGSIIGNPTTTPNIIANILTLEAGENIGKDDGELDYTLYTQVSDLYAFAGGDIGTIDEGIFEPGILNAGDLNLEAEAGDIAIRAESNLYPGEVIAEVIGLEASSSILALLDGLENISDIQASVLYLNAGGDIGKDDGELDYTLYTQVSDLYAFAGGDIGTIDEGIFEPGILNAGDLNLEAEAGDIAIRAESNLYVGSVTADEIVGLEATGSINGAGETEPNITAEMLSLDAESGDINELTTDIDELYAYAGGSISLYDISEGGLTLVDVQAGLGEEADVYIYAERDIDVGYVYDPWYVYLESYSGSINGTETEYDANVETENLEMYAAQDIGKDNALYTDVNTLYAFAGGDIGTIDDGIFEPGILNAGDLALVEVEATNVAIRAESNLYVGEVTGDEIVGLEATGSIIGLDLGWDEDEDLPLPLPLPLANISADVLNLFADRSISGAFFEEFLLTYVNTVNASAGVTQPGEIYLLNVAPALTLNNVEVSNGSGSVVIASLGGDLYVGSVSDPSDVILLAGDWITEGSASIIGLDNAGLPNVVTPDLWLIAGYLEDLGGVGSIYGNYAEGYFLTDVESLVAYAPDSISLYNLDDITLENVSTAGLTSIYIVAEGDINVGYVSDGYWDEFGNWVGGQVSLTSSGSINDFIGGDTIVADTLTLSAANGIGTEANPLSTEVNNLSAETTGEGADIYIDEFDGLDSLAVVTNNNGTVVINFASSLTFLGDLLSADAPATAVTFENTGGAVDMDDFNAASADILAHDSSDLRSVTTTGDFNFTTTTGAINVFPGTIESLTGGVNLSALDGSILAVGSDPALSPGMHLRAAADSLLFASGVIASLVGPFDILLSSGNLAVDIGSAIGGISGVLTGTTPSGTILVNNAPPGIVYFNGLAVWGTPPAPTGPATDIISESSYLLFWRMILPMLENLALYNNPFTPGGPVYFYHPLTEADWSAFDAFILEEGAYEFIEGALDIIGHEGLLPLLEYIKSKKP